MRGAWASVLRLLSNLVYLNIGVAVFVRMTYCDTRKRRAVAGSAVQRNSVPHRYPVILHIRYNKFDCEFVLYRYLNTLNTCRLIIGIEHAVHTH